MTYKVSAANLVVLLDRYQTLLEYIEQHTVDGHGTFLVHIHGKRPVKIGRINKSSKLPFPTEDIEIVMD